MTKTDTNAKASKTSKAETSAEEITKYPVSRLRKDCIKLFGVSPSTFDGAATGVSGELTVDEMRNRIKNWKNKQVKGD